MRHTPGPWRYEASTKTIRSEPANYWLATMDSFDGAVNHQANARIMTAAPELLAALEECADLLVETLMIGADSDTVKHARAAIAKARGE
jgi:hypothetical protein